MYFLPGCGRVFCGKCSAMRRTFMVPSEDTSTMLGDDLHLESMSEAHCSIFSPVKAAVAVLNKMKTDSTTTAVPSVPSSSGPQHFVRPIRRGGVTNVDADQKKQQQQQQQRNNQKLRSYQQRMCISCKKEVLSMFPSQLLLTNLSVNFSPI